MQVKVSEKEVRITEHSIINEGEFCVNKCFFTFPEAFEGCEITAFFNGIPVPVSSDNFCFVPSLKKGNAVLGVCAYKKENDEMRTVYSPVPAVFWVGNGSFTDEITAEEIPQISQFEEYCRMLLEKSGNKSDYSNALKGEGCGEIIAVDDISPVEHNMKVFVEEASAEKVKGKKLYIYSRNLLNKITLLTGFLQSDGKIVSSLKQFRCFEGYLPAGKYTLSINEGATLMSFSNILVEGKYSPVNSVGVEKYTFQVPSSSKVTLSFRKADNSDFSDADRIQLERGENRTSYEECKVKIYNFDESGELEFPSPPFQKATVFCESPSTELRIRYNRDINLAFRNLQSGLSSTEAE